MLHYSLKRWNFTKKKKLHILNLFSVKKFNEFPKELFFAWSKKDSMGALNHLLSLENPINLPILASLNEDQLTSIKNNPQGCLNLYEKALTALTPKSSETTPAITIAAMADFKSQDTNSKEVGV